MRQPVERKLREKARRLARHRQTQLWLLVSPKEAQRLVEGTVPLAVKRMARLSLDSTEKP